MTQETVRAAAKRIAEHAVIHRLDRVRLVLHGGEPLLLGTAGLRDILTQLRQTVGAVTTMELGMQTNGVQLTADICELMVEFGVRIGVSLDGDVTANDRHRRFRNGASSHDLVLRAVALLRRPEFRSSYGGLLCTVDIDNDPIAVYEALRVLDPPRIDFLLPHATWENPPRRGSAQTPYADWLGVIHQRWSTDGYPMSIRLFDSLRSLAVGGLTTTEAIGLAPADLVVVETDGTWEQVDSLKVTFEGAAATDLDVFANSVDEVAGHPAMRTRQGSVEALCRTCRECSLVERCGGGLYAHRYRPGNAFDNPSVYCADLKVLIQLTEPPASQPPRSGKGIAVVPQEILDDLATGYGDVRTMRFLAAGQAGIIRALVAEVIGQVTAHEHAEAAKAAWEVLRRLDVESPSSVERVLRHPFLRQWAVDCLREPTEDKWAYLTSIAAAAATHAEAAGIDARPWLAADVFLPTVGSTTSPTWRVELGGHHVMIEDLDPYRNSFHKPVAPRQSAEEAQTWRSMIEQAFALVEQEVPGQLPGLRHALRSVVPLQPAPDGRRMSAAARGAFGAVAVAPVSTADVLAVLLVHEVQHVKLAALLDLCDLVESKHPALLRVQWRDDPRPPDAVLQGIFAHFGVADIWRARSRQRPDDLAAAASFHLYREWTEHAIADLLRCGALTPIGRVFVDRLDWKVRSWNGEH